MLKLLKVFLGTTLLLLLLTGSCIFYAFKIEPYRITANYAQTECQFRYCGTAIPFLTVRSTAR